MIADKFIEHAKALLEKAANDADKSFPTNQYLKIEKGEPIFSCLKKKDESKDLKLIKSLAEERLEQVSILDILFISKHWYDWTKFFGPLSGLDSKIVDPIERYLIGPVGASM